MPYHILIAKGQGRKQEVIRKRKQSLYREVYVGTAKNAGSLKGK